MTIELDTADIVDSTLTDDETTVEESVVVEEPIKKESKTNKEASAIELLAQRNEARRQADAASKEAARMKEEIEKLRQDSELVVKAQLEMEHKQNKIDFFNKTPIAKELEADIDAVVAEQGLSYDKAFILVAGEKNPSLLMDEQFRNKQTANNELSGVPKQPGVNYDAPTTDDLSKMSEKEFMDWSNGMAKKQRAGQGMTS